MKMVECVVCKRIPPKVIFDYAHKIFEGYSKEQVHAIAKEACEIINDLDKKNRIFFCGRSYAMILSGLFYILAWKHRCRVTQRRVSYAFPSARPSRNPEDRFTECAVRSSFKRWKKMMPEVSDWINDFFQLNKNEGEKP